MTSVSDHDFKYHYLIFFITWVVKIEIGFDPLYDVRWNDFSLRRFSKKNYVQPVISEFLYVFGEKSFDIVNASF